MAEYVSEAALQRVRKAALREVRRKERAVDTAIEMLERRIFTLLDQKRLVSQANALGLARGYYGRVADRMVELQNAITDFVTASTT